MIMWDIQNENGVGHDIDARISVVETEDWLNYWRVANWKRLIKGLVDVRNNWWAERPMGWTDGIIYYDDTTAHAILQEISWSLRSAYHTSLQALPG